MKPTQPKKIEKNEYSKSILLKNGVIAGIIGFISWIILPLLFFPLAGYYKFKETYFNELLQLLVNPKLYYQSFFVGIIFFLFFYLTLKYKQKFIMWLGIIIYALFYLGYLFLLFFFRFTDL